MEPEPRSSSRNRVLVASTVAVAASILALRLLVPPLVGLADNGDFDRLLRPAGLVQESTRYEDRYFGWMQPRFLWAARSADPSGYRSSEMLLVEAAVRASRLFGAPFFDIRVLAGLHIVLLLTALGLLVSACRDLTGPAQLGAAFLLVLFFTDPGYTAPFSSLYSQTASLIFLLLTSAIAGEAIRRGRLGGLFLPAYFLCAALFVCSKPQESIHAPLLAIFGLSLAWRGVPPRSRIAALALAVALCGLAWRYYRSAERSIGWVTRYNMLFMSILPTSPDPQADLAELGLDASWARFAGTSAWTPDSPARDPRIRAFVEGRSGAPSPRVFLVRHPQRLFALLERTARVTYALRPPDLGNYAQETGAAPLRQAAGPWSAIRTHLSGFPWLFALFGATLVAAGATYRRASQRGRRFREGLALAVLMAAMDFGIVATGDTQIEAIRHLYSFQALCDLILVADLVWLAQTLALRAGVRPFIMASALPGRPFRPSSRS